MNRRLGLSDDSTVGMSVAASASVGASIPLTQIGAQARAEGRQIDQQTLQSAYDFARKAAEAVASGEVSQAIVVDGAGIGSAMAANKVPGVRAAACYSVALAKNSRPSPACFRACRARHRGRARRRRIAPRALRRSPR